MIEHNRIWAKSVRAIVGDKWKPWMLIRIGSRQFFVCLSVNSAVSDIRFTLTLLPLFSPLVTCQTLEQIEELILWEWILGWDSLLSVFPLSVYFFFSFSDQILKCSSINFEFCVFFDETIKSNLFLLFSSSYSPRNFSNSLFTFEVWMTTRKLSTGIEMNESLRNWGTCPFSRIENWLLAAGVSRETNWLFCPFCLWMT